VSGNTLFTNPYALSIITYFLMNWRNGSDGMCVSKLIETGMFFLLLLLKIANMRWRGKAGFFGCKPNRRRGKAGFSNEVLRKAPLPRGEGFGVRPNACDNFAPGCH
jgi:hypothetical protein